MEYNLMGESGVCLDFDKLLVEDDVPAMDTAFYELRSQPLTFKSPQIEVKNVPPRNLRINMRQELDRQHVIQQQNTQEKKKHEPEFRVVTPQQSSAVQIAAPQNSTELPAKVLKFQTGLENPTRHHVKESQKRQVQKFIHDQMGKGDTITTQSLPSALTAAANSLNMTGPSMNYMTGSSAPVEPDSPGSVPLSSTATSVDELLSDLVGCESYEQGMDDDLTFIEPTLSSMEQPGPMSQTMPGDTTTFLDHHYDSSAPGIHSSTSCPVDLAEPAKPIGGRQRQNTPPQYLSNDQTRMWYRERQKKDNHNVIEKRRRLTINEKIKELGEMLPRNSDIRLSSDMRQNKGSILKASVDYISKLQRDQGKMRHMEHRQRELENTNRKMLLRLQEMEMLMQAHGVSKNSSQQLLSDVLKQSIPPGAATGMSDIKQEVPPGADLMEDTCPVQGDPMMSLSPPVIHTSQNVTVEEISDMLL